MIVFFVYAQKKQNKNATVTMATLHESNFFSFLLYLIPYVMVNFNFMYCTNFLKKNLEPANPLKANFQKSLHLS